MRPLTCINLSYLSSPAARRELHLAEQLQLQHMQDGGADNTQQPTRAIAMVALWHSGPWPPEPPSDGAEADPGAAAAARGTLTSLARVPRGPRPLCRCPLEGALGELMDWLAGEGCQPVPTATRGSVTGPASGAAAARATAGAQKGGKGAAAKAAGEEVRWGVRMLERARKLSGALRVAVGSHCCCRSAE